MTRDEAIKIAAQRFSTQYSYEYVNVPTYLVDSLAALGLLHFETTDEKVSLAAVNRLTGAIIEVRHSRHGGNPTELGTITRAGAYEIIDILLKSGFRITKDE